MDIGVYKNELKKLFSDEYILVGEYNGCLQKTTYKHKCGYIRECTPVALKSIKFCPKCNPYKPPRLQVFYIKGCCEQGLKKWKTELLEKYNYKCAISGLSNNLAVHHIKSFSSILKDAMVELNISNIKEEIGTDWPRKQLLVKLIIEKHTLDLGIPLNKTVHTFVHTICGKDPDIYKWTKLIKVMANFKLSSSENVDKNVLKYELNEYFKTHSEEVE